MQSVPETLASLVQPARVHRRLYSDPAIFEFELERIFGAAWIYIGHESQVKNRGDYFRTFIGRKPVVLVRDAEGEVRVIHNQCAHRGSLVVKIRASGAKRCRYSSAYRIALMRPRASASCASMYQL